MKLKFILTTLYSHKAELFHFVQNYVNENPFLIDDNAMFSTDSTTSENIKVNENDTSSWTTSENEKENDTLSWKEYLLAIIASSRPGGGRPGSPGCSNIQILIARKKQMLYTYLFYRFYKLLDNQFTGEMLVLCKQITNFILTNCFWLLIPIAYYFISTISLYLNRDHKYSIEMQFKIPSQAICSTDLLANGSKRSFITFQNCIMTLTKMKRHIKPMLKWSIFLKRDIRSFNRLKGIKNTLGLVCVNRLNLVLDTVHQSYAGLGLKSLLTHEYSSILVRIITQGYSRLHKKKYYGIYNILVLGGIGVVVWYKYRDSNKTHPMPSEPYDWFKNPTAVVEGYKRVTFWIQKDLEIYMKHAYTFEPPFNELVNLPIFWECWERGSQSDKQLMEGVCTAIMIATFMTTNIIIPLATNVFLPQPTLV